MRAAPAGAISPESPRALTPTLSRSGRGCQSGGERLGVSVPGPKRRRANAGRCSICVIDDCAINAIVLKMRCHPMPIANPAYPLERGSWPPPPLTPASAASCADSPRPTAPGFA
ncbi:hypothetical protein [Lysobacter gummosus]|uniref:hypothetical protein n=1 Tax=Lysobacter gummosus TaxID=262324 RepID=UPI0036379F90